MSSGDSKESDIQDLGFKGRKYNFCSKRDFLGCFLLQGALEQSESKILRFQRELSEAKAELERKLSEKEEEAERLRYLGLCC